MDSTFNTDALLNTPISEQMDTERPKVPEGDWRVILGEPAIVPAGESLKLRIPCVVKDEAVTSLPEFKDYDHVTVNLDIWLDVEEGPDGTQRLSSARGKNVDLGRLRASLGMNQPGQNFSIPSLTGSGPYIAKVKHNTDKKKKGADGEPITYVNVVQIARAA